MANPLSAITPLLTLLSNEIKILPATGGAVEELQHPDQDEIDDTVINREIERETLKDSEENIDQISAQIWGVTTGGAKGDKVGS